MAFGELGEFAEEVRVVSGLQFQVDTEKRGGQQFLFENVPGALGPAPGEVGERFGPPQLRRLAMVVQGVFVVAAFGDGAGLVAQPPEPEEVDRIVVDLDQVRTLTGHQRDALDVIEVAA